MRSLQNDKAVLQAAVEARESKLQKMNELQTSFKVLSEKVAQQDALRMELGECNRRYQDALSDCEKAKQTNQDYQEQLKKNQETISQLQAQVKHEQAKSSSAQAQLETQQMQVQKLKAERNCYKQKGDSLAKEMARICRGNRTVRDVEKLIADDAARRQEVVLLRDQKRKALADVQYYRTGYEQLKQATACAGMEDATKVLERNAELERVCSELTEYVQAKEMQLGTLKQVNEALQAEMKDLAMSNMSKNDV